MPKFNIKKVPKGFCFPVTTKDLKCFIAQYDGLFQNVELSGISRSESKGSLSSDLSRFWVGIITATRIDNNWIFDLKLEALREEHIMKHREKITQQTFTDINNWIANKVSLNKSAPQEPRQLFLCFEYKNDKIISASHEVRLNI